MFAELRKIPTFATTEEFLRYFGIESLDDLPILNQETIEDFKET